MIRLLSVLPPVIKLFSTKVKAAVIKSHQCRKDCLSIISKHFTTLTEGHKPHDVMESWPWTRLTKIIIFNRCVVHLISGGHAEYKFCFYNEVNTSVRALISVLFMYSDMYSLVAVNSYAFLTTPQISHAWIDAHYHAAN